MKFTPALIRLNLFVCLLGLAGLIMGLMPHGSREPEVRNPEGKAQPVSAAAAAEEKASEDYGRLSLSFEENRGQADAGVDFAARGPGYTLALSSTEAVFALNRQSSRDSSPAISKTLEEKRSPLGEARESARSNTPAAILRMKLVGANRSATVEGRNQLEGKVNYLIGNDPAKWQTGVSTFAKVRYAEVYPGIAVEYYGNQKQLEYDFILDPGQDPRTIALEFAGADDVEVETSTGDLLVRVKEQTIRQHAPVTYQESASGERREVESRYVLKDGGHVGFDVGEYDRSAPLVIDPVLQYSTYLGGDGGDTANAITVDSAGNAYIIGFTESSNFPTVNPLGVVAIGTIDVFVAKLNADGSALVFSTYLGGDDGPDYGHDIKLDSAGNIYITGSTYTSNFPTVNPIDGTSNGWFDAFVTKINATGSAILYSTYLGGRSEDYGSSIALDSAGNAYVTGNTESSNFPTANAIDGTLGGNRDAFVAKINAAGSALVYSTYLGGSVRERAATDPDWLDSGNAEDYGADVSVDSAGNAYITGFADSTDFPMVIPIQGTNGGNGDAFVTKINAAGSALVYSTYLGGGERDSGRGIAVDSAGNAYVTGYKRSANFPLLNPIPGLSGQNFVMKINAAGTALIYSTALDDGSCDAIALDSAGNAYVTGSNGNASVTKINAAGSAVLYSTDVGAPDSCCPSKDEVGFDIAVDSAGNVYISGHTQSPCFPTTVGAFDTTFNGYYIPELGQGPPEAWGDGFVFKISDTGTPPPLSNSCPPPGPTVKFSDPIYIVQEDCTSVTITVDRMGDPSSAASVDYYSSDVTATERRDYITALGTLHFAPGETSKSFEVLINEDSYVEGNEIFRLTLSNPSGVSISGSDNTNVSITDDVSEPATNVIDDPRTFVCQNYHDFLNRQPDAAGWDFWTSQITSCNSDLGCIEDRRINVSAAFFLSIEFQQTGYLVQRAYLSAYGNGAGDSTIGGPHSLLVPIVRFREFLSDSQKITRGVVVLQAGWEQHLENNKQAFFAEFVRRSLFTSTFPISLTPTEFVDLLNVNAGGVLSSSELATAINLFGGATDTSNVTARAQAVRQVVESQILQTAEFNPAFVLMQYIGYLRRNPNDPQDTDHSGYDFWLTKLDQFNSNYIDAEMVKAFITSIEYRDRFGGGTQTPPPTPTPTPDPAATPTFVPTTFVVINTNNSGPGSLRQAVLDANAVKGANTITFDPLFFDTPQTIVLSGTTLTISDTLTITGPGANLLTVSGNNAVRIFDIGRAAASISGMTITQGNGMTGAFAGYGGGIHNRGVLTVTNMVVTDNKAPIDGGGIYNGDNGNRATLHVINCTISNNVADSDNAGAGNGGGGLYSFQSIMTITNSTISGNSVGGEAFIGAGGLSSSGPTTITNSTISGNSSGVDAGGIYTGGGVFTLTNSTVVNNTAVRRGGGVRAHSFATFTVGNTIIANNSDDGGGPDFDGNLTSSGYNLIKSTKSTTITGTKTGNLTGIDPYLGPLQDNGGATQTHALLSGSPAIDKGESFGSTADQRGLTRPVDNPFIPNPAGGDGSDIGAFEEPSTAEPSPTPTPTATPSPSPKPPPGLLIVTNTNDSGAGSLRQAVLTANGASGANTITFDPAVFNTPRTIVLAGTVLTISDRLTITGPGANLLTVSGNNAVRVFAISSGVTASISGMTITQGNGTTGAFAGFGGGIYSQGALTLTNLVVTGNSATIDGGGIYNSTSCTLKVINCTISNNVADSDNAGSGNGGGGLYSNTSGIMTITNSTISGNSVGADATGGGGLASFGSTTITNSTISGNSSGVDGGGIYKGNGAVTLTNSTVVNNTAVRDGGGVWRDTGSTFTVRNTIIANNSDDGTAPDFRGTVNSTGYNLIKNTTGTAISGTTTGNLNGVDPNLGPLQDNGGLTQTHALLSGSPAIDQGQSSGSALDQRGLTRIADHPSIPNVTGGDGSDIGAFEEGAVVPTPTPTPTPTPIPTPTPTPTPTPVPTPVPGTIVVTNANNNGAGSLRQAVLDANAAAGANTITFDPAVFNTPQTITLASVITINATDNMPVTITGPGANLLTISGNNTVRAFTVNSGETASISGMTLTMTAVLNSGNLTIQNSTFNANTNGSGGAIINTGASLTVIGCTFTNNTNTAPGVNGAGGAAIYSTTSATITNSTFSNNRALSGAGGGAIDNRGVMSIGGSTFTGNSTNSTGQNSRGGAINSQGQSQLTINNSVFTGNSSTKEGGAIYHSPNDSPSSLTITDSTISNNTANSDSDTTGSGGGLLLAGTGSVTITGSTINGNTANTGSTGTGFGGGISVSMPLNLTNSTVSGNNAGRNGGGIYASGTAAAIVTIVSSTIVNNRAVIDGGGLVRASVSNPVNLRNTIIANNTDDGTAPDVFGSVVSQGYNLIESTTGATITGTTTGNLTGVDPNLGPLQDNGGPTQTHALLSGSPAIDKGESSGSTVDQRGLTRPVDHASIPNATGGNGADIGAFEVQQFSAAIYNFNGNGPHRRRDHCHPHRRR